MAASGACFGFEVSFDGGQQGLFRIRGGARPRKGRRCLVSPKHREGAVRAALGPSPLPHGRGTNTTGLRRYFLGSSLMVNAYG